MNTVKEKKTAPVKPYEDSPSEYSSMYDKMPYVWDADLNVEKVFRRESGNIIKAHRCKIEEPFKVKHE